MPGCILCAWERSRTPNTSTMQFFTADRIATLSTNLLLDNLVDFSKQQAKTNNSNLQIRNANVIAMLKAELASRTA